jgi:hypothetical protein
MSDAAYDKVKLDMLNTRQEIQPDLVDRDTRKLMRSEAEATLATGETSPHAEAVLKLLAHVEASERDWKAAREVHRAEQRRSCDRLATAISHRSHPLPPNATIEERILVLLEQRSGEWLTAGEIATILGLNGRIVAGRLRRAREAGTVRIRFNGRQLAYQLWEPVK